MNEPAETQVAVHCLYDEIVDVHDLIPHPRNPNTHGAAQIELLRRLIVHHGWRAPVVVSNLSGFVVSGHGRMMAAQGMGDQRVPVVRQDFVTDEDEAAHLIADNQIAELSQWDNSKLKDILDELKTDEVDLEVAGFSANAFNDLLSEMGMNLDPSASGKLLTEADTEKAGGKLGSQFTDRQDGEAGAFIHVACPKCGEDFSFRKSEVM